MNLHMQSKGLGRKVLNAYWLLVTDYCEMLEDRGQLRKELLKGILAKIHKESQKANEKNEEKD